MFDFIALFIGAVWEYSVAQLSTLFGFNPVIEIPEQTTLFKAVVEAIKSIIAG